MGDEGQIEDHVAYQAGTHFIEDFDVDDLTTDQWQGLRDGDPRVKLPADEVVIQNVA